MKIRANRAVAIAKKKLEQLKWKIGQNLDQFIFEIGTGNRKVTALILVQAVDVPTLMSNVKMSFIDGRRSYKPIEPVANEYTNAFKDLQQEILKNPTFKKRKKISEKD